jgi:hypothetical protein
MSSENRIQIDPNTADVKTLVQIPGVGEALAGRIHEYRPFDSSRDLLRVPGIGEATLRRMESYLRLNEISSKPSGVVKDQLESKEVSGSATPDEPLPEDSGAPEIATESAAKEPAKPSPARIKQQRTFLTGVDPLWLAVGTAVASIFLSVLLSLAILRGINRTLDFGQHSVVQEIRGGLMEVQTDLEEVSSRLESIDSRLEAVEGLSGQVRTLENAFTTIREDVDETLLQMEETRALVDEMAGEVKSLSTRVSVFDRFLQGLDDLLTDLVPLPESE